MQVCFGRFVCFSLRIAAIAVAMQALLVATPIIARADGAAQIAGVNRRLVTIVRSAPAYSRVSGLLVDAPQFAALPRPSGARPPLPIRIPIALLRVSRLERVLHVRTSAVNANFWGVFDGGRGTFVKVTLHF
jgi:hypothetical protein